MQVLTWHPLRRVGQQWIAKATKTAAVKVRAWRCGSFQDLCSGQLCSLPNKFMTFTNSLFQILKELLEFYWGLHLMDCSYLYMLYMALIAMSSQFQPGSYSLFREFRSHFFSRKHYVSLVVSTHLPFYCYGTSGFILLWFLSYCIVTRMSSQLYQKVFLWPYISRLCLMSGIY